MTYQNQSQSRKPVNLNNRPMVRLVWIIIFTFALLSFPGHTTGTPVWPHEKSDLPPSEEAVFGMLDNGFRYVIIPNDEPPERVSMRLLVKAGSLMETEAQRGLAHFVEHMAFRGTENFEPDEMVEYFQRLGMAFGPDTNAHTGFDQTVFYLDLPEARQELLEDGLLLLSDYAGKIRFPKPELEREREVIIEEKQERDSADYRAFVEELRFIAPNSLLPERLPIGIEEVIKNAPREAFLDFYQRWYIPQNIILVAVGDIKPEELEPLIAEYFEELEPAEDPAEPPDLGELKERGIQARVHRESEASAVKVSIQAAGPLSERPDTTATRKEKITLNLAADMFNIRFDSMARQEDMPFSEGRAYIRDWFDFMRNPGAALTTRPEDWQAALTLLEQEVRRTLEHGFTETEFQQAKERMLNQYERRVRRRETRNSRRLSSQLARTMARNKVWTSPETELELTRNVLAELTPGQVHEKLQQTWPEKERLIFVSGNLPEETSEKEVYRTLVNSMRKKVEPPTEKEIEQFAYTDFGAPGEIVSRKNHEDLGITEVRFENNAAMLIKPTDFQADTIHVAVRFGSGLLSLPEVKPGLSLLAPAVFIEGGLKEHSRESLQRIFAGRDVETDFAVEDDAFLLKGTTSPHDLGDQFRLLAAYMQAPGYREEALRMARRKFDQLYVQIRHTVRGVIENEVNNFIGGGDPRFGIPEREKIKTLNMEDLRTWLQPALEQGFLTVAVVGDVKVEEALQWGRETFGALPEREKEKPEQKERRQIEFPHEKELRQFEFPTEIPRAAALVYWPTNDMWDISRTRRLNFLARVISDRLRSRVREEMGKAYSPYAFHQASDTYDDFGYIQALVQCQRKHASEIADIVREIGAELVEKGIDADQHQRIHAPMKARLREQVRNNQYWLRQVLLPAHEYPVRLDWARTMQKDIAAITKDEINQLAEKYLQEENALKILVLPKVKNINTDLDPVRQRGQGRFRVYLSGPHLKITALNAKFKITSSQKNKFKRNRLFYP